MDFVKKFFFIFLIFCVTAGVVYYLKHSAELSSSKNKSISAQAPQPVTPKVLPEEDFLDGGKRDLDSKKQTRRGSD